MVVGEKVTGRSAPAVARRRRLGDIAIRVSTYLLLFATWYLLSRVTHQSKLPPPERVWEELTSIFSDGLFLRNFFATMQVFLEAVGIGFAVGTVIGVLMGRTHYFEAFFRDGVTIIMGLPGVVIIIVSLMMFGLSPWGRVTAVAIGMVPLVAINIAEGARAVPRDLLAMAASFGIPQQRRLRHIVMPATAPYVFAAARFALATGFKAAAMVEVFGGSSGMGFQLRSEFSRFSVDGVLAWTALILAIVIILEIGILKPLERRIFRWRQEAFG